MATVTTSPSFKANTAYIELPQCCRCTAWFGIASDRGLCRRIKAGSEKACLAGLHAGLVTEGSFGCLLFEAKDQN